MERITGLLAQIHLPGRPSLYSIGAFLCLILVSLWCQNSGACNLRRFLSCLLEHSHAGRAGMALQTGLLTQDFLHCIFPS